MTVDRIGVEAIDRRRFEALAGYIRVPFVVLAVQEFEWLTTSDGRVLGVLTWDRTDHDFGWVALGRDELLRYRAIAVNSSLASAAAACSDLCARMIELANESDEAFHQGDVTGTPVDFFKLAAQEKRLSPTFRVLAAEARYSPARELISNMMRYHEDADGNFVEQFQTTAFDARLWELYLFATFTELGYARNTESAVPDFLLSGLRGRLGVEATTANPPNHGDIPRPRNTDEFVNYLENYIPIKLARALRKKLNRKPSYWAIPQMCDTPFVLAIQDFHGPGVMRMIVSAATEYCFGVHHSVRNGKRYIERINQHRFGALSEESGFFNLPDSEHISAVILNPQGTITKFNRMGYLAGFGDPRTKMVRTGIRRGERDHSDPAPKAFEQRVHEAGYDETWVEGMVVLHNPRARIRLDPMQIEGAAHEFLQEDGTIMSLMPDFHPLFSQTNITISDG